MRARTSIALVLASVVAACSSTSSGSGTSAASEKACLDTIDALARAAERCGGNYQANYDAALKNAAGGDCKKVVSIRDEAALRGTCFSSLRSISCPDFTAAKLDETCKAQLQRPAGFAPTLGPASVVADDL